MLNTTELCNAIIYCLQQTKHKNDPLNEGHLMRISYVLNIIYYLKYNKTIISPYDLNEYTISVYGPYNDTIRERFSDLYSLESKFINNGMANQVLIKRNNVFDVEKVPFDINEIEPKIQQIIKQYATKLWEMHPYDLCYHFMQEKQVDNLNNAIKNGELGAHEFNIPYNFEQSVTYFKDHQFFDNL